MDELLPPRCEFAKFTGRGSKGPAEVIWRGGWTDAGFKQNQMKKPLQMI